MSGTKVADHTETRSAVSNLHRKTELERIGSIQRCWAGEVTGVVESLAVALKNWSLPPSPTKRDRV